MLQDNDRPPTELFPEDIDPNLPADQDRCIAWFESQGKASVLAGMADVIKRHGSNYAVDELLASEGFGNENEAGQQFVRAAFNGLARRASSGN